MAKAVEIGVSFKVEKSDADKAEKNLRDRFNKVGKTFGNSLIAGAKGFLASSAAGAIAAIFSNPYDQLAGRIDKTLDEAAAIQTRAEQYGVSSGELFKEQKTAEIYGVRDFEAVFSRFANLYGKAKAGEFDYLREFTGAENVVDAYHQVLESLRNLKGEERETAAQKIFGEGGARQLSGLLGAPIEEIQGRRKTILEAAGKSLGIPQIEGYKAESDENAWSLILQKAADLKAVQENLKVQRETAGFAERLGSINEKFLQKQNEIATKQIERETAQIRNIETFAKMASSTEDIKTTLIDIQTKLIPALDKLINLWDNILTLLKKFVEKPPFWK